MSGAGEVLDGRYEILRPAGVGGSASVFEARDGRTGARVAIKVLYGSGAPIDRRFEREAEVLAHLVHPGIVRCLGYGLTREGARYLVMEWLEGEDLSARLRRGPLAVSAAVTVARQVAEALAVAHARGIVHRDIKPANLFLVDGRVDLVKVLDFGIARELDGAVFTTPGLVIGTPAYMSPEQARGEAGIAPSTDVFSLGCVLWECLTAERLFTGDDMRAVLAKILLQEAPRLSRVRPEAPAELDELLARMLDKTAAGRPRDASAVAAALGALPPLDAEPSGVSASGAARSGALGRGERRIWSAVIVELPARQSVAASLDAPTVPVRAAVATPAGPAAHPLDGAWKAVRPLGARIERLADGALLVTCDPPGASTDQAYRLGRAARALVRVLPGARAVLATGAADSPARTSIGDLVDRASALLRLVPASRVFVDEVTARLLEQRFELVARGAALELGREHDGGDAAARTVLGRRTPFVGREAELAVLHGLCARTCDDGEASAALVTGLVGLGKSRLRAELQRHIEERWPAAQVWQGRGDPVGAGSSFGVLAELVRRAAGLVDGEDALRRRHKLLGRLQAVLPPDDAARAAAFLGEVVDVRADESRVDLQAARHDPILMGDQVRRAWEDWLAAETAKGPLVLLLEDLHWGDRSTVDLVEHALKVLRERPLFVVGFARPELHDKFPRLWAGVGVTELALRPLARRACAELVHAVLGERQAAPDVDRVVERSEGNPFFLEELLRAVGTGAGQDLPETVLAMVQLRLAGLESDARRVLRAAAVFGPVFWTGGVAALLPRGGGALDLEGWLERLRALELVSRRTESRFVGEDEWVFRHALVREAAVAMNVTRDARLGNRLAAEWLLVAGESDPVRLAEHFELGAEPARAAALRRRAAEQALEGNDFGAVVVHATRALALGVPPADRAAVELLRAEAHRWLGEYDPAARSALAAKDTAARGSPTWLHAIGELGLLATIRGGAPRLEDLALEVLAVAPPSADDEAARWPYLNTVARLAGQLLHQGDLARADALLAAAEAVTAEGMHGEPLGRLLSARALRALLSGDPWGHLECLQAGARDHERIGDLRAAYFVHVNVAYGHMLFGAWGEAVRILEGVLRDARRLGLEGAAVAARHNLGLALVHVGRGEEALAVETAAADTAKAQGHGLMEGVCRIYLARILLRLGRPTDAELEARSALELAAGRAVQLANARAYLARALYEQGRLEESLAPAAAAYAALETGTIYEGEAAIRLVWVDVLAAAGRADEAQQALAAARTWLEERAQGVPEGAARDGFLAAVPEHRRLRELALPARGSESSGF